MDIWEIDKLVLFLTFVIPGFVSLKAYQLLVPGPMRSSGDQLIDALAYSCVNYAVLWLPIAWVESSRLSAIAPPAYYGFYLLVFFVAPILWVLGWKFLRTRRWVSNRLPHPSGKAWDFVFDQRKVLWAKVVLENGTVVGGWYGPHSFSSSAPAEEQIFIEQSWVLDDLGQFVRPKRDTAGVLILSKQISHIELRNSKETVHDTPDATG